VAEYGYEKTYELRTWYIAYLSLVMRFSVLLNLLKVFRSCSCLLVSTLSYFISMDFKKRLQSV